jgi:hypothetical protein
MPMHVRYTSAPGGSLAFAVERLSDGKFYDFASASFVAANPKAATSPLTELTSSGLRGYYAATYAGTQAWWDGSYAVAIVDASSGAAVGAFSVAMQAGTDILRMPGAA